VLSLRSVFLQSVEKVHVTSSCNQGKAVTRVRLSWNPTHCKTIARTYFEPAVAAVVAVVLCDQFTFLLDDVGIPLNYRHMEGFGVHTFKLVAACGKETLVKFHWKPKCGE
jgi:hypothetical protein